MAMSMENCITADTIANAVRMLRNAQPRKKSIMIVEGESDRRFLEVCVRGRIECYPAKGKAKVLAALDVLNKEEESKWFFALMDADYDHLTGKSYPHELATVTDLHDLECELLSSPALEKVVREYCSSDKCHAAFGERDFPALTQRIRGELLSQGSVLGAIRFINARDNLNIRFSGLAYESVLMAKTIEVKVELAVRYLLSRGGHRSLDVKALQAEVETILRSGYEPWQLCQGHDLVNLFLLGVRRVWGRGSLRDGDVDIGLRLSYEEAFLGNAGFGKLILRFLSSSPGP